MQNITRAVQLLREVSDALAASMVDRNTTQTEPNNIPAQQSTSTITTGRHYVAPNTTRSQELSRLFAPYPMIQNRRGSGFRGRSFR